ncbi:preprotein translocase subunit SecG [Granulicella mallensis]|jgi:preprotein translocase subunit SecG|uniref:Protein-export membrane protein SecG n=1 Tax=Granulicella mallensis TaxID=940614 RepID=A0A7W7ZMA0_9BACT|nr:preprotein translocase subunit SecG [Granulicella mallensis]MBB5062204.1 preprotein translocase subunit SecG [Granulicella mallensis]
MGAHPSSVPIHYFRTLPQLRPEGNARTMIILLVILHVVVCLFLIGVVLVQQGKSADLAGAFGGQGSQTAFGPRGAANLLTRLTTWSAIIFMLTSIGLTVMMSRNAGGHSVFSGTPSSQTTPAKK